MRQAARDHAKFFVPTTRTWSNSTFESGLSPKRYPTSFPAAPYLVPRSPLPRPPQPPTSSPAAPYLSLQPMLPLPPPHACWLDEAASEMGDRELADVWVCCTEWVCTGSLLPAPLRARGACVCVCGLAAPSAPLLWVCGCGGGLGWAGAPRNGLLSLKICTNSTRMRSPSTRRSSVRRAGLVCSLHLS
jgi:hypothetical protein